MPRGAAEHYVRPPLVPREPAARWVAVWRFRLLALAVLAALVLGAVLLYRQVSGANAQDPGLEAAPVLVTGPAAVDQAALDRG